jgi:hypothetical protein
MEVKKIIHIILFLFFLIFNHSLFAAVVACTGGKTPVTLTLPFNSAAQITAGLSGDSSTYRLLYTWDKVRLGTSQTTCSADVNNKALVSWSEYVVPINGQQPLVYNNNYIFPTAIAGLGISFDDVNVTNQSISSNSMGGLRRANYWDLNTTGYYWDAWFDVRIKLWKIPGTFDMSQFNASGLVDIGPVKVVQALQINSAGDTWNPGQPQRGENSLPNSWTTNDVTVVGQLSFIPGTCDIASQTVELGEHTQSAITHSGSSPWRSFSFVAMCPKALGYGGQVDMNLGGSNTYTQNTSATTGMILTVHPRTNIIDNTRGIIGLKPGGAQGYGVQLAWGLAPTQPATGEPTSPLKFEQSIIMDNVNYGMSGNTSSRVFNMAARYVRTTGVATAGRADASIEVVASYN